MVSTGALLWISCRPLIKMVLCTSCGFFLSRQDLFSTLAARGAGQVLLNITIPSLMFSKMVPAFNSQNVAALGPLVTMGVIYHLIGLVIALVVRELFWVPRRFHSGILAAGTWSNYGDIPTAVIMSITVGAPFSPGDTDLGVAYVSAFILVFFVTLFPLGGHTWIAKDFNGPNKEDEEVKMELKERHRRILGGIKRRLNVLFWRRPRDEYDVERNGADTHNNQKEPSSSAECTSSAKDTRISEMEEVSRLRHTVKHVSFDTASESHHIQERPHVHINISSPTTSVHDALSPTATMVSPTERDFSKEPKEKSTVEENVYTDEPEDASETIISKVLKVMRTFLTPATIAILLAFPISLVRPLKGLFVPLDNSPIPNAPDGNPPLYFIYDTTNFLGAASVPLGLVCLGAALAKMQVPKDLRKLPLGAISGLAIGKLIVSPILGVIIVNAFVKIGFIHEEDKVLRFVAMFFSCMPTATTQVFLTQVYSGTGEAEHLSAFLIPQYGLMFISMTAVTAYSLHLLF